MNETTIIEVLDDLEQRRWGAVVRRGEFALEQMPDEPVLLVALARAHLGLGDHTLGARFAERAAGRLPDEVDVLALVAVAQLRCQMTFEALGLAARLCDVLPRHSVGYLLRAEAQLCVGQPESARTSASIAISLDRDHPGGWLLRSRAAIDCGDIRAASQAAKKAYALSPDRVETAQLMAVVSEIAGQHGRYERYHSAALELSLSTGAAVRSDVTEMVLDLIDAGLPTPVGAGQR